jgi:hypothetical protein
MQTNNNKRLTKKRNRPKRKAQVTYDLLPRLKLSTADYLIAPVGVSTTPVTYSLEDTTMYPTTGQFAAYPQVFKPYMAASTNSVFDFVGRIRYRFLEVRLNFLGSQGNLLATGDLFNRMRVLIVYSKTNYLGTITMNSLTVDRLVDLRDVDKVLADKVICLSSTAYQQSSGYNVPATKTIHLKIPLDYIVEVFSNAGGATWDSRNGSFEMYIVSDSTVSPNPQVSGQTRLYYEILD